MSDERIDAQQPGWSSAKGGYFERTSTKGERTLREQTHPVYKVTRLHDSFPGALRVVGVTHERLDPSTDRLNSLRQTLIANASSLQERVAFHDPEQGARISLEMEEIRRGVIRGIVTRDETGQLEAQESPQAAWVNLRYVNGNLVSGSFQAESTVKETEPVRPWSETFPELINYIRHQDPRSRESTRWEIQSRYGLTLQSFAGQSSPVVQEAHDLANDWTIKLVDALPMDDQVEAVGLLSRYAWHESLMAYLLEEIDGQKVGSVTELKLDKDVFLSEVLKDEIFVVKDEDPTDFRQVLEVERFGESDFNWREVEIDEKALLERGEDEWRVVDHGLKEYGDEVAVQQYRFKIDRSNGTITMACSLGGKPKWTSSFPIFIPHQEIVEDFENLPQDFRGIKDKVGVQFTKDSSLTH